MDGIRQWAFGICAAAIACGLAQLALPKSSMQRVFNITSSVFFLGCLLSPIALPSIDLTVPPQSELQRRIDEKTARLSDAANEQTNMAASEGVRLAAMKTLADMGVQANKIYINIHEDGEGGISISECEVQLDEQYRSRHTEIRGTLMERLGVNVVIGYEKGVTT